MIDPTARPRPRLAELVRALDWHDVRWVMSGSTVAALYGAAIEPNDLDVVPALDATNLARLAALLGQLRAVPAFLPNLRNGPTLEECRAWQPDPATEEHLDHLFVTALGMLDIPPRLTGTFAELMTGATATSIAGVEVWVCDPRTVLDRLPAKPRQKDTARAGEYQRLRGRLDQSTSLLAKEVPGDVVFRPKPDQ